MNNRFLLVRLGLKLSALTSKNRFIALTSRLATVGIVLGVATLITVLAVMRGFENEIRHSLIREFDHLQIYAYNDYYPASLYEELRSLDSVVAVTGVAKSFGLIKGLKQYTPVIIMSFESADADLELPDIKDDEIYLSSNHTLYYEEGDEVSLVLPQPGRMKPKLVSPKYRGNYHSSQLGRQGAMIGLVSYDTFKRISGINHLDSLTIVVDDLYATSNVKQYIADRYGMMYQSFDWKDKYQPLFSALRMQRALMVFILSMITLVAMFSLVSGLVMLSADKQEEIAVLRTMGLSRLNVMNIFIMQGAYITFIGVSLGAMLAVILCYFAQDVATLLESILGFQLIDERVYATSKLPTDLNISLILSVAMSAFIIGIIASILPARRAAKLDPATVLRYV